MNLHSIDDSSTIILRASCISIHRSDHSISKDVNISFKTCIQAPIYMV